MKRAGFTMIELIFVIVILGILAAVAVPKLVGVKDQADEGVIKGFVGTLNRTVGPAKWSEAIFDGNGSILTDGNSAAAYDISITETEFPAAFAEGSIIDVSNCLANDVNTSQAQTGGVVLSSSDSSYHIICRDSSASVSPKFWYKEGAVALSVEINGTTLKAKAP